MLPMPPLPRNVDFIKLQPWRRKLALYPRLQRGGLCDSEQGLLRAARTLTDAPLDVCTTPLTPMLSLVLHAAHSRAPQQACT
jgi:hypothetical protein